MGNCVYLYEIHTACYFLIEQWLMSLKSKQLLICSLYTCTCRKIYEVFGTISFSISMCIWYRGNIKVKPMNKPSITDVCFSFVCVGSMKCSLKSKNQSEYPFIIISKIDINIHLWNEYIVNCNIGSFRLLSPP